VQVGDLWSLGEHRLFCGDSTKKESYDVLLKGELVNLFLTDPPYGVDYSAKNRFLNTIGKGNAVQEPIFGDNDSPIDMKESLWIPSFSMAYANAAEGCSYYISAPQGGELLMMMMMSIEQSGWLLKHSIIWVKNNFVLGRSDYHYKHEPILFGWKGSGHKFYGNHGETSVWEIDKPFKSDLHPTMKPVELFSRAIRNSSKENDIVLDIFAGSGTSFVACETLKRRCYGIELDPEYCDVIITRWENLTGRKAVKISQ